MQRSRETTKCALWQRLQPLASRVGRMASPAISKPAWRGMRRGTSANARARNIATFRSVSTATCAEAEAEAGETRRRACHDRSRRSTNPSAPGSVWFDAETPPHPRRNPPRTKPRRPRPRRSRLPHRHRHRAIAESPQLRTARRAVAGQALPIDRPPGRSPRRPRPGARRLLADAGVSGDRGGDRRCSMRSRRPTRSRPRAPRVSNACNCRSPTAMR